MKKSCCAPTRSDGESGERLHGSGVPPAQQVTQRMVRGMKALPGGTFLMGSEDEDANEGDGEGPVREVTVMPFRISPVAVTNAQFATFAKATGYVTDAERFGWSFVFHLFVPAEVAKVIAKRPAGAPWWIPVPGASWKVPEGPGSGIGDRANHPVVHVSWRDALAYCDWSGTRLPSESEWEYAARGGREQTRYPWGNELTPQGKHHCNIWQGSFPQRNTEEDGHLGTAPVKAYRPNGFGLYNVVGNIWEWCQDPFTEPAAPPDARAIRGGSYLCHASYCNRYRLAARSFNTTDSSTGNTGFRIAADA